MDLNTRLRIATRIHFALLRHMGEGIDVGQMLKHEAQAYEVLWVCDASGDAELVALARQYRRALTLEVEAQAPAGHAHQDTPWAKDTSGFGVSQPPEAAELGVKAGRLIPTLTVAISPNGKTRRRHASYWLNPANWLRG